MIVQISRYRNGHDYLSDDAAIKLAALLELESAQPVIASAHAERAKSDDARKFWERLAGVAAGVVVAVGVGGPPSPVQAAQASLIDTTPSSVHYVNKHKRRRKASPLAWIAGQLRAMLAPQPALALA